MKINRRDEELKRLGDMLRRDLEMIRARQAEKEEKR